MSIVYKTLFEVVLLHEYYLINSKGESYFTITDDQLREKLLQEKIRDNFYRLQSDWEIKVLESSESLIKGWRMRLLPNITGFRVAIEVKKQTLADGTITYTPFITPNEDSMIFFSIRPRNAEGNQLGNFPFQATTKSIYYFDNDNSVNDKIFPSLSKPIDSINSAKKYEQGELAIVTGQGIFEFMNKKNTAPADQWRKVEGTGFVTGADRTLLPPAFTYYFPADSNVTQCSFSLKKSDGDLVKNIDFSQTGRIATAALNFSRDENNQELPAGHFELEVIGNNNFNDTRSFYLDKTIYSGDNLAVIGIKISKTGNGFALLRSDGTLTTHILPDGTKVPHTKYELRFKSRIVYFRYLSKDDKKLKPAPEILQFHLDDENGKLISKAPRSSSFTAFPFKRNGSTPPDYLPHPESTAITIGEQQRLFADIVVPVAGIFSKGP